MFRKLDRSIVVRVSIAVLSLGVIVSCYKTDSIHSPRCYTKRIQEEIYQLTFGDVEAFNALVKCGSSVVPYLIEATDNEDETISLASIAILGEIGEDAKDAIPSLLRIIENESASFFVFDEKTILATNAITKMGENGKEIIHNLVSQNIIALEDEDSNVRSNAAYVLGNMGKEAKEAIPALISALKDEDSDVRYYAAYALGNMGEEAKEAIPALISALKDEDSYVRFNAAGALGNMGKEAKEAIPALISALKDEDSNVRSNAAYVLGNMGKEAKEAIPALIFALKDEYSNVRYRAAYALVNMGKETKEAILALIWALEDEDRHVVYSYPPSLASRITAYKRENPPVACKFPVIKEILSWKCPKPSPTDTVNSPQQPKPTSVTTQPNQKR
jgi:HEAT repeat protein